LIRPGQGSASVRLYSNDDGHDDCKRRLAAFSACSLRWLDWYVSCGLSLGIMKEKIMNLILLIVVLLLLFGGGGYYWNSRRG
jgi:hypothetical protein